MRLAVVGGVVVVVVDGVDFLVRVFLIRGGVAAAPAAAIDDLSDAFVLLFLVFFFIGFVSATGNKSCTPVKLSMVRKKLWTRLYNVGEVRSLRFKTDRMMV